MKKLTSGFLLVIIVFVQFSFAQQVSDEQIVAQIRTEAMKNSQIMETLGYLTDVFGPRLTSSPNIKAAQAWTRDKMTSWGLQNAAIEPWGE
ncbi:MAG TPA: hypothetical protein PKY82_29125, partial [Pyrinomonadaceae bacterium]|nr:hypothetical protein [Pyrinomonadaceae bacterium]